MMAVHPKPAAKPAPVRIKLVALPTEHGGWGMLGAPILLGLLAAPSVPGALLALAALAGFLTRQPLRLAVTDLRRGKHYPRTSWAIGFATGYAQVALLAFALALINTSAPIWLPVAAALALGGYQFSCDLRAQGRAFLPEIAGASALALVVTAITLAGGLDTVRAWVLAAVLAAQAVTAVSYAASRLRQSRGEAIDRKEVVLGHVAAAVLVGAFVVWGILRWPILAAFVALTVRAAWGLSPMARQVRPSFVGVQEIGYSLLTVICAYLSV
ncbi:MAG TPA: YwiC-like family protein [Fimbriimonas sp.]